MTGMTANKILKPIYPVSIDKVRDALQPVHPSLLLSDSDRERPLLLIIHLERGGHCCAFSHSFSISSIVIPNSFISRKTEGRDCIRKLLRLAVIICSRASAETK